MGRTYRIGTRRSSLALKQVEEIVNSLKRFYPEFSYEILGIDTYGDKDKVTPISEIEGTDFFTRQIDEALLKGEIDFAVHSAKDLPDMIRKGLRVVAITRSIDPYDALVSKNNLTLNKLKYGAKIGTSSLRRKMQIRKYRKDFQIVDIRGNIEERLRFLSETDLDAIVIAAAGLVRLGWEDKISQRIPFEIIQPHPLQGALALMTRDNDLELIELLSIVDSKESVLI
ncbi:MAG: hydroxymethylbilane synthase [Candidatus Omnitrophica bacterium]|nr:hydroxymethylbilane synthase [Candidatus Omnitrophota bacterium]